MTKKEAAPADIRGGDEAEKNGGDQTNHRPADLITQEAIGSDREFFARNQNRNFRLRLAYPDEAKLSVGPGIPHVAVVRLCPGRRLRFGFLLSRHEATEDERLIAERIRVEGGAICRAMAKVPGNRRLMRKRGLI